MGTRAKGWGLKCGMWGWCLPEASSEHCNTASCRRKSYLGCGVELGPTSGSLRATQYSFSADCLEWTERLRCVGEWVAKTTTGALTVWPATVVTLLPSPFFTRVVSNIAPPLFEMASASPWVYFKGSKLAQRGNLIAERMPPTPESPPASPV